MDVFDLQARIGLDTSDYEKNLANITGSFSKLKNTVKYAAAGIYSASDAAASVLSAVAEPFNKALPDNMRFFDGINKKIKELPASINENMASAFKTSAETADSYLSSVAEHSDSLLQLLGNDTKNSADIANNALISLSGNISGINDVCADPLKKLAALFELLRSGACEAEDRSKIISGETDILKNAAAGYKELFDSSSAVNGSLRDETDTLQKTNAAFLSHSDTVGSLKGQYDSSSGAFSSFFDLLLKYADSGAEAVAENSEKIKSSNTNTIGSFRSARSETEMLLEAQKENYRREYENILKAAEQGNSSLYAKDTEAKHALYRQSEFELEKYRLLHAAKAKDSSRAFADGISSDSARAAENASALAAESVGGLRSKISDFAAAGADSGSAYGSSFVSTARSIIDRLLNSNIDANNDGVTNIADVVKVTTNSLNGRKTATGGVFTSPAVRLIGEDGPEAVVPLEKNIGWIDKVAEKLANAIAVTNNSNNNNNNSAFTVVMENVNILNNDDIDKLNFELEMSRRRTLAAMGG